VASSGLIPQPLLISPPREAAEQTYTVGRAQRRRQAGRRQAAPASSLELYGSEKQVWHVPPFGAAMPLRGVARSPIAREMFERVAGADQPSFQIRLKIHAHHDVGELVPLAGFAGALHQEVRDAGR
jgi:hypothetical protein